VILDLLEHRYGQLYADHWAFVRFSQENKLRLDFTSPPRRPVLLADGMKNNARAGHGERRGIGLTGSRVFPPLSVVFVLNPAGPGRETWQSA
jgi:hypothetical protein